MATVTKIKFVRGPSLTPPRLTVAIGPNNAGKSRFLREIAQAVTRSNAPRVVVRDIEVDSARVRDVAEKLIARGTDSSGNYIFDSMTPDLASISQQRPQAAWIDQQLASGAIDALLPYFGPELVAQLTTERRLALVNRQTNKNENIEAPQSAPQAAFEADPSVMVKVNRYVAQAFGQQLALDTSKFAIVQFRIAPANMPTAKVQGQLQQLECLDDQGDGIRAFAGLIVSTAVVARPVVLIDEPEAFLHPPQAFLAGRSIATFARSDHQMIVATHSSEVLRGMLAETTSLNVMRFARGGGAFTRRKLNAGTLRKIANDPLLSSARVLDGLFYEGVIIVESDGDAVIYRRVLEQIGLDGAFHFVNSYSKAASPKVAEPYQQMGVPHAMIVDLDLLRQRGELKNFATRVGLAWSDVQTPYDEFLKAVEANDTPDLRLQVVSAQVEEMQKLILQPDKLAALEALRRKAAAVRESASEWSEMKKSGIENLSVKARAAFRRLDEIFRSQGVFMVPVGERESWLPNSAPYSSNKNAWTGLALKALRKKLSSKHPLRTFVSDISNYLRS